jgi:asparagine synthase (glutamine-hydrolysing)
VCGISGAVDLREAGLDVAVAERQLATLAHRGPDASGWHRAPGAVVSQNRLAIIDLTTGDPPITDETGAIGVALNGEIYNYRELRATLTGQSHRFATSGDTEVLAHLAEDLAPADIARRLEGMFAFAVWDDSRRRLVLGRDRVGKKPLYYWHDGQRLVFGSEIKAVLAHPAVPRDLNERAIPAYLTFGYVPTPETFFAGIRSVPPASVLVFSEEGLEIQEYWAPPVPGVSCTPVEASLDEAAGSVRAMLEAAVQRRLLSDVPLGAFLSGGIDSSAIVGLMSLASDAPVETFTIGFHDDEGHDEREYARQVARHFGTNHHERVVEPHAVDLVEQLLWHHDQPFGDSSAIPTYLLSEFTSEHVTVALSGDGGDELFAGYERFAAARAAAQLGRVPSSVRRAGLATLRSSAAVLRGSYWPQRLVRFAGRAELGLPDAYLSWLSYVDEERRQALLAGRPADRGRDWGLEDYRRIWAGSAGAPLTDRLLNINFRTYLLDDLTVKTDRMSMAHGLEVRSPFLDRELTEFALCLPPETKLRGLSLKRVLKRAVADLLPPNIVSRRKRGFGVPLRRWFQTDLQPFVESRLGGPESRVRSHLAAAEVDRLLEEHRAGTRDHGHALWALLTLEVFLRREGW